MGKKSKTQKSHMTEDVPLECTQEDFQELSKQVAELSTEEASEELLECARYGETDAVRALLDAFPDIINSVDGSGSTALHKACANGHASTATLLIQRGANHLRNLSGNTPLHWAAASGHEQIVRLVLERSEHVDVLQKNDFGRSVLTEGFSSQNHGVVELLLEHDSASEEKLLEGGTQVDAEEEKGSNESKSSTSAEKKTSVLHEFSLCDEPGLPRDNRDPLRIRELSIAQADNPFGDSASQDTTGYGIWCASLVMARWMASPEMTRRFSEKTILELGAGCGVPGLAAAHYSNASRVYVTDLNPTTIENLQYNVDLNLKDDDERVVASAIDWCDMTTWPKEKLDYVIGSDLIYQASIVPLLKEVVLGLLKPDTGRFLYVAPDTGRDGLPQFIESMKHEGCSLIESKKAPDHFYSNPLNDGDDEMCFLHFNELSSSTYILYEFRCS